MRRWKWTLTALLVVGLLGAPKLRAGGFGGFFKRVKRNVKNNAKRKARNTKEAAKDRVVESKDNVVNSATSTTLGQAATGQITKDTLKADARAKLETKVAETSPMAGAAMQGESPSDGLKQSVRDRIDAMKARYSEGALADRVTEGVVPEGDATGDAGGFGSSLREKLDAIKQQREQRLMQGFEEPIGGAVDGIGASSGTLDLQTAGVGDFAAIDGISQADGAAIVEYRNANGGITLDDLTGVVGFKKYLLIRTYVSGDDADDEDDD